jgi:hypothetical protein
MHQGINASRQGLAIGKAPLPAIALPLPIGERCKPIGPPALCAAPFKNARPYRLACPCLA